MNGLPRCLFFILISILSIDPSSSYKLSNETFTFARSHSFFNVEPDWPLPLSRTVSFQFRTEHPQGLLLYHGVKNMPLNSTYELYLMLDNGQIKIIHIFYQDGRDVESFSVGKALNTDKWHRVHLHIDPSKGQLTISVDNAEETKTLQSLLDHPSYGMKNQSGHHQASFLYFGGMDPENPVWNQQYNYVRFVGCMKEVEFSHSSVPLQAFQLGNHSQLDSGCLDQCKKHDMCQNKGRCINHYTSTSCDCFGTANENEICSSANLTAITLRGNSFLTYHVFDWRDKVHSEPNRISITFKTLLRDSVLFYGAGKLPVNNYLVMNIIDGTLFFEINFGDGPLTAIMGNTLHDELWHNVTMVRHSQKVVVYLDRHVEELNITGNKHHLHFDPEVYVGGLSPRAAGLYTRKMFVGCLREVYLNDQNILFSLRDNKEKTVRHHGIIPVEYGCKVLDVIPITFSAIGGYILVNRTQKGRSQNLSLSVEFKTLRETGFLVAGRLISPTKNTTGHWELSLKKGSVFFVITPDESVPEKQWVLTEGMHLVDNYWHQVDMVFKDGKVVLTVDFRHTSEAMYSVPMDFYGNIVVGTNISEITTGFIGCLRDIHVNGVFLDPRDFGPFAQVQGKVSLDNCRFVDPCANPRACEHGGKCFVESQRKGCNCNGTGYSGETCHFASYKRTCEELYLLGYRESGVYKIDIDRNGPMPPAHVFCDMDPGDSTIATRVENNLPKEMVVRKAGMESFYMNITYRDFTPEMLQSLIDQSKHCSQHFKYECHLTPLGLFTYTWMVSSFGNKVLHVGNATSGHCQCGMGKSCAEPTNLCNCDSSDRPWRTDEGTYTDPVDLGITKIYILQPSKMDKDAQARINLGPLECVETDTQLYVITFKTKHSYLEVPGWRNGDMAFSFRTSNDRAVLLYQASAYTDHGYFRVLLTSDHELSFEFTVNGVPQSVKVNSRRRLNSGEWQQVWVDHDTHHMRFTINLDSVMIDLADEEVGPFEGPMFIGAVPGQFARDSPIKEGFIGCFRGLVINNAVVDVYQYLTRRAADIATGCKPSCLPNPCQNSATCHEYWGTYQCECLNPAAHSGLNCEKNINENSLTFLTAGSFFHNKTNETFGDNDDSLLKSNFLISFRTYEKNALILYAFDHLNNFVQLHIANGHVIFTFNSDRKVYDLAVESKTISEGFPTQVIIERGATQTTLTVNKIKSAIQVPVDHVKTYQQQPWLEGENKELVQPARGPYGTIPHMQMFIGGVSKEGMQQGIPGFVGCIQGLKIGNQVFNLKKAAKSKEAHGEVLPDCKMLCDLYPCQHGGLCIEDWKNNHTSCDCSVTSYTGETCSKEYSGSFDGKSVVQYSLKTDSLIPESISIHLAFSSTDSRDIKRILLTVHFAASTRYILVALNPNGTLIFEENLGIQKIVFVAAARKGALLDGYRHWLRYQRTGTEQYKLELDGKPQIASLVNSDKTVMNGLESFIFLGGNLKESPFTEHANFKGCISNVEINVDNVHAKPFETAFGYGYEEGISVLDKVKVQGDVSEDKCADFAVGVYPEKVSPAIPPEVISEKWHPEPPFLIPHSMKSEHVEAKILKEVSISTGRVALVMAILLLIVLMAVALYIWKLQKKHELMEFDEDTRSFYAKRPPSHPVKAVSFHEKPFLPPEPPSGLPLHQTPELAELRTKSYINNTKDSPYKDPEYSPDYRRGEAADASDALHMNRLRPTSSQELEWDTAADTEDLITSTLAADVNDDDLMGDYESGQDEPYDETDMIPVRGVPISLLNGSGSSIQDKPLVFTGSKGQNRAPMASTSEVTLHRLSESFA